MADEAQNIKETHLKPDVAGSDNKSLEVNHT